MVAVAVTIAGRDVGAPTVVDRTGAIAYATGVERADTGVDIVTHTVAVGVGCTASATHTEGVHLVSVAVAVSFRNVGATAFEHLARTTTDAASIQVLAGAVVVGGIGIEVAGRVVCATGHLVVVTDAVAVHIGRTGTTTHTQGVELVSVTIAISLGNVGTATVVDGAGTIADSAGIHGADAGVDIITDAVTVGIGGAGSTTDSNGVELVSVTVTVACRDAGASTFEDGSWTIADTAGVHGTHTGVFVVTDAVAVGIGRAVSVADANGVELAHAGVHIVTDAVCIGVGRTVPTTHIQGVELVAVAVAIPGGDVRTAAFEDGAGSVADSALIELADTGVDIITDAVAVGIGRAGASTDTEGVELVAVAVAVTGWNVGAPAFVDLAGTITDAAGIVKQTGCGGRVAEVARGQVGTRVHVVADAISVTVQTVRHPKEIDVVELDALVVGIGPQHHLELKGRSVGDGSLVQVGRGEVVLQAAQHDGLAIQDVLDANEVGIFEAARLRESGTHFQFRVSADVDFTGGPHAVKVGVASLEDGVSGQHGHEPIRRSAIGDAPFRLLNGGVGRAGPSVIQHGLVAKGFLPDDLRSNPLAPKVGQVAIRVDIAERQGIAVIAGVTHKDAGVVIVRGGRVVIAGRFVLATRNLLRVADAILVGVRRAVSVADTQRVVLAHTIIDIVTDAIAVRIGGAVSSTHADGVFLSDAIVNIVTDAIAVGIGRATSTADSDGVELVAVAVTITSRDARTAALATLVELVAIAVTVSSRDVRTAAIVDGTRSAADSTGVENGAGAIVDRGVGIVIAGRRLSTPLDGGGCHTEIEGLHAREGSAGGDFNAALHQGIAARSVRATDSIPVTVVDGEGVAARVEVGGLRNGRVVVVRVGAAGEDGGSVFIGDGPRRLRAIVVGDEIDRDGTLVSNHAGAIVERGVRIVVASRGIRTSITAEVTGAVLVGRIRIKVAGRVVRATAGDLARWGARVGRQEAFAEATRLEQGEHPVGLTLGEQVHASVIGVVHVVLDHVDRAACHVADGTAVVGAV